MTLLLWFSLSVSGISGLNFEDFNSMEKPKVTDLQMESLLLDATLVAAFAPFAAMFFPLAALLDAGSSCRRRHLGSFWEATASVWTVAQVGFSHLGGIWTRLWNAATF